MLTGHDREWHDRALRRCELRVGETVCIEVLDRFRLRPLIRSHLNQHLAFTALILHFLRKFTTQLDRAQRRLGERPTRLLVDNRPEPQVRLFRWIILLLDFEPIHRVDAAHSVEWRRKVL
jgi:hypothetical protein